MLATPGADEEIVKLDLPAQVFGGVEMRDPFFGRSGIIARFQAALQAASVRWSQSAGQSAPLQKNPRALLRPFRVLPPQKKEA